MKILEEVFRRSLNSEKAFEHKSVLFIPSESYDAATITVLQGLQKLGFTVYTYQRPNINSWFCNEVISKIPAWMRFDFILSNMHWGTQWHLYKKLGLSNYPKILIDGCDNRARHTWQDKYEFYCGKYKGRTRPPDDILVQSIQPYRWMEPLDGYEPDVVFTSQKNPGDKDTTYLPFGIHREYLKFREKRSTNERSIDFTNIPGPGDKRKELTECLNRNSLPGNVHNGAARGTVEFPKPIRKRAMGDNNVHSYHRWGADWEYFSLLNRTKVLLYPGVYDRPHWDSQRPWEALVSGCLVVTEEPLIDMSQYPMTELCPFAVYRSLNDMVARCRWLHKHQSDLDCYRRDATAGALKYFAPMPMARYFLRRILDATLAV